ncbi:MAG: Rne/Rng family ribonuclease [Candidatus Dependentiae bacterium]|nr:Rne/Rng family ribonuclease [Candidatus Dependentiae bacterium]
MKKFLINESPWETRIAITRNGSLQNIYFDPRTGEQLERSYYKGIVTKIIPGIQTAFVDIGQERSGFLHISEIDRDLAIRRMALTNEDGEEFDEDEKRPEYSRRDRDITKILREGEPVLVQVSKEPIYEKGAKLTTCFTLPGRFIVLMPNIPRIGISKKIDTFEKRSALRELLKTNLPAGMGAIIRTTCEGHSEREILRDLSFLVKTWNEIQERFKNAKNEEKIYEDIDLTLQVIRDNVDDELESIICDNKTVESRVYKFVKETAPEFVNRIELYTGQPALFEKYDIERQIDQALQRKVHLKSGGSLIIETTEAMTVVDVNTSRFTGTSGSLEDTILKTNLEAADEIVRQLRLRNFGGLIVIDFIDMASNANRQRLFRHFERTLRDHDKFQSVVLRISEFGLVQMTRKRSGKTLIQQLTSTCVCCGGNGFVKSVQNEAYTILRLISQELATQKIKGDIQLAVHDQVFNYLINTEYNAILSLEKEFRCKITLVVAETTRLSVFEVRAKPA